MAFPINITYRDLAPSDEMERLIRGEAAKLGRFFNGIVDCRVLLEYAHHHQREGAPFHVRIDVNVPGDSIVVNHLPDIRETVRGSEELQIRKSEQVDARYKDPELAVRDAFKKAGRQIQDYARRLNPHS